MQRNIQNVLRFNKEYTCLGHYFDWLDFRQFVFSIISRKKISILVTRLYVKRTRK